MKLGNFHRDQKAGWSTQKVVLAGEAGPCASQSLQTIAEEDIDLHVEDLSRMVLQLAKTQEEILKRLETIEQRSESRSSRSCRHPRKQRNKWRWRFCSAKSKKCCRSSPTTPAQLILQQQTKLLLTCLATPPNDPFHHIVFCSALRDRIECNKVSSRGRPPPHWLSLMLGYLQLPINHFFPHHPQITNPMTLQQLINKTPRLTGFLVAAPTSASLFPFL